jgi:ATP-dependent DNA helicase RecG
MNDYDSHEPRRCNGFMSTKWGKPVNTAELHALLDRLRTEPRETEWLEFKGSDAEPQAIGEYISALANSAALHNREYAYLVFGVEDQSHRVIGTKFKPHKKKIGNQELENWLATQLQPPIDFEMIESIYDDKPIVIFRIEPAHNTPVRFKGIEYIRVGSYKKKLGDHPEKARKIWIKKPVVDWSAQICKDATLADLDPRAIARARDEFRKKYPDKAVDVDTWDEGTFLNKAKVTIKGKITRTAILLLGREESEHFISPSVAKISWILKDEHNIEKDYEHFGPPFLLNTDALFAKIRNLKYRYLQDNTLFPTEITQYEPYVIREALHNCIAHQDYELRGRINVVELPDELLFTNLGSFIPESVETVIEQDSPPELYRNPFLANAMVNLKLIDTQGGGIKKMFMMQRNRFFPLPEYDLIDPEKVKVKIYGKILDKNYTQTLINETDLDLKAVICLDKVQKKKRLSEHEYKFMKSKKLLEGRYPNLFVSSHIAAVTGDKTAYIRNRVFDDAHYKKMIISFITEYGSASRKDIDNLLLDKLSDALDEQQKKNKVRNLIYAMANKDNTIVNKGSSAKPHWVLTGNAI